MAKVKIDLDKIFFIDKISNFLQFDDEKYKPAIDHLIIQERLLNSCYFASKIDFEEEKRMQCGLVRASVSELVSIEGMPDVKYYNGGKEFKLNSTKDPLLCIVKELRNLQLHLSSVEMNSQKKSMLCGNPDKIENAIPIIREIKYIDNLDINDFSNLKNYSLYEEDGFLKSLNWFNEQQKEWGISTMLHEASYSYAKYLSCIMRRKT